MKKLLLLLPFVLLSCSEELENVPNRDLIVFHSTTFVSETYEVDKEDVMGVPISGTETRKDVIKFKDNNRIEYFTADDYGNIQPGTKSTTGAFKIDYPRIYDIIAVHIFDETSIAINKNGTTMSFNAGGKTFKNSLERFD